MRNGSLVSCGGRQVDSVGEAEESLIGKSKYRLHWIPASYHIHVKGVMPLWNLGN